MFGRQTYLMLLGHPIRGRGGIGRRARFRSVWETMGVRIPSTAPRRSKLRCYQKPALGRFFHALRCCSFSPKSLRFSGAPVKRKGCLFVFIRKQKRFEPSQNRASRNAERKSSEKSKYFWEETDRKVTFFICFFYAPRLQSPVKMSRTFSSLRSRNTARRSEFRFRMMTWRRCLTP